VSANPPVAQHFLPRFYLRRFGEGEEVLVRRRSGSTFKTGTAAIGYENQLYDHPDLPPGAVETEHLRLVDGQGAAALRDLEENGVPDRWSEERYNLAFYIAVQHARTRDSRERTAWSRRLRQYAAGREITPDLVASFLREVHLRCEPSESEVAAAHDIATHAPVPDDDLTELFLSVIVDPPDELVEHLIAMEWTLEVARKPRFVTSDAPVVRWRAPTPRDAFEGIGIANAEEVRYPVDSSRQLVLRQPGNGRELHEQVEPDRVRECNQDLAYSCFEFIVGHPRRELQLARLDLPEHRPALRFNRGPLVERQPNGDLRDSGNEVLHMWVPRR
jgi:hypothetical protein